MNGIPDDVRDQQPEPEPEPTDPYAEEALALPGDYVPTKESLLVVTLRAPKSAEFFRVHPGSGYTMNVAIYEYELSSGVGKVPYLVMPEYIGALGALWRAARLFTCINRFGIVFMWATKLPVPGNSGNAWADARLVIAEEALTQWCRMESDKRPGGTYRCEHPVDDFGEPKWPEWSPAQLRAAACRDDKLINRYDHPVLRELRGELGGGD